jgi:intein/homing endonuclease
MDIVDIIKNTKQIYMSESSLETMMDIERVMDSLDMYAFKNWKKGELVEGPIRKKHWVEATFMWPKKSMPDPDGAKRLLGYNAVVTYENAALKTPVKIESYDDFRPGTKKAKLREDPVWLVKVKLPVELIKEFRDGYMEIEGSEVDLQEIDDAYEEGLDQSELMNTKTDEEQQDGA